MNDDWNPNDYSGWQAIGAYILLGLGWLAFSYIAPLLIALLRFIGA